MISAKKNIQKRYGDNITNYFRHKIFDLLFSRSSKFLINYKEETIYNKNQEYNKRFYKKKESILKLIKILKYYINYLTYFCRPVFAKFYYNSILQNYYDIQADIFYRKNYLKKGEEDDVIKNSSNNIDDKEDKDDKSLSKNNSNLIFDIYTRKFIDTTNNILTSINAESEDKSNESYVLKMKTSNNKYITIKSSNDDYLFDLIENIKTKRKEENEKNKNLNINTNCSLSQVKKPSSKKKKIIKKYKYFNSNKNIIENNVFTNYNIMKTLTKKKSNGNNININSNINLSEIKTKYNKLNYNNSQKKTNKSQIKKNKYLIASEKEKRNLNILKKKIIKKVSLNMNTMKPSILSLYKRSSLNIKCNYNKNNNYKKTSFSIYKNNSIINSHSNIYNKLYNSNSNSPLNKIKNFKKENKSDIFNFSRKNKLKKNEIKKNLNFNVTNYLSNKKKIQKLINKNPNNYNINNNFTNKINNHHKNQIYIALYKKTSNNNSLNKDQIHKLKNNINNKYKKELFCRKKILGKNEKKSILINNLSNYFNLKYLRSKSSIKNKTKFLNNPENLHTFSMRIKNHNKNHSTSGYLNINNQFFNQNFSFNNIESYSKNNNYGGKNKLKHPYIKNKSISICNNSIDKLTKNINKIPNVKLLYSKQNTIEKNGLNLNVNFNLNNINININGNSSENNKINNLNNNFSNKIINKLNINNNDSNFNILSSNNNNNNMNQIKENNNNLIIENANNKKNSSYYKSRNKLPNRISKKNIEKLLNNLNFNIKNLQNNSKQIENIISSKNSNANYKNKTKLKTNSSFSQSGCNKSISLISKIQTINDKSKQTKVENKKINNFMINKRYKEAINLKKKDNSINNKCSGLIIKK